MTMPCPPQTQAERNQIKEDDAHWNGQDTSAMKGYRLLFPAIFLASFAASGQGTFYFSNRDLSSGVNARFVLPTDTPGTSSVGLNFAAQVFGGPDGTPPGQLVPLDPPSTTFRGAAGTALAGYLLPVPVTVLGTSGGGRATILVRVFDGGSWEQASFRFEGIYSMILAGDVTPPNLPMGSSPLVLQAVPEPSSGLLCLLCLVLTGGGVWIRLTDASDATRRPPRFPPTKVATRQVPEGR